MLAEPTIERRSLRLNPFIFPSDTDFRYALLVVAVLGASLFIYDWLFRALFMGEWIAMYRSCFAAQDQVGPAPQFDESVLSAPATWELLADRQQVWRVCIRPLELRQGLWMLGGVGIVFALAAALYLAAPIWRLWRSGLEPLSDAAAPGLPAYLRELVREAELRRSPTFVWNPGAASGSALAFGHLGRYYVALPPGIVGKFYRAKDRQSFRAIVLHELSHLRNGDVDKTYFTIAVWDAFVVAALLPFLFSLGSAIMAGNQALDFAWLALATLVLALFVLLMRNAVLRAREIYADVRSSSWDDGSGGMQQVLASLAPLKPGRMRPLLYRHPAPSTRVEAVAEPTRLFTLSFGDAFATGLATTISLSGLTTLLSFLLPSGMTITAYLLTLLLLAPLAAGVIGLAIWRESFAAMHSGLLLGGIGRISLGLALGLILGRVLAFDAATHASIMALGNSLPVLILFVLLWCGLLFVGVYAFSSWTQQSARVWIARATRYQLLRLALVPGLLIGACILTIWLGSLFSLVDVGPQILPILFMLDPSITLPSLVPALVLLPALMSLWLFPLAAAWLRRRDDSFEASWALLPATPSVLPLPALERPQIWLVLGSGVVAGVLFIAWLLPTRLQLGLYTDLSRLPEDVQARIAAAFLLRTQLVQAFATIVATVLALRMRAFHGLFAAFLAACALSAGIELMRLARGRAASLSEFWGSLLSYAPIGQLEALLLAGLLALLAQHYALPMRAGIWAGLLASIPVLLLASARNLAQGTSAEPLISPAVAPLLLLCFVLVAPLLSLGMVLRLLRQARAVGLQYLWVPSMAGTLLLLVTAVVRPIAAPLTDLASVLVGTVLALLLVVIALLITTLRHRR
jgi:hypothetical protein